MTLGRTPFSRTIQAFVFAALTSIGFASTASAAGSLANSTAPYVGFGYGAATMLDPEDTLMGTGLNRRDNAWKVYAGFQLFGFIAVEASYMELPDFVGTVSSVSRHEWSPQVAALSGVLRLPLGDEVALFAKGGGTFWRVKSKVTDTSGTPFLISSATEEGAGVIVGGGIELNFGDEGDTSLRIEYELLDKVGDEAATGEGKIGLVTAGFNWKF